MQRPAPEQIGTERLLLRRPVRPDAEAIFSRYASDPVVTRYLAWPRHQSVSDSEAFVDFCDGEWNQLGCGPYLVFSAASGELLGSTGLMLAELDAAETGYVFARDAWGRGYATESLGAMVGLTQVIGLRQLRAHCHPDHRASVRVLEKCGFLLEGRMMEAQVFPNLDPSRQDVLCYALPVGGR
jgi:ribosomal-protein-alanine N-acetyltransferase